MSRSRKQTLKARRNRSRKAKKPTQNKQASIAWIKRMHRGLRLKKQKMQCKNFGENKKQYGLLFMVTLYQYPLINHYYKMACQFCKRKINAVYSGFQRCRFRINLSSVWNFVYSSFVTSFWNFTGLLKNLLPQLPESPSPSCSPSQQGPLLSLTPPCPRLPNIGSTCFFNSTLQVLLTVKDILLLHFEQAKTGCVHVIKYQYQNNTDQIEVTVTFAEMPMISAFLEFLQAVKDEENVNTKLRQLHFRIGERYKRFSSFNQQDSEEVLRCLLDGIRMEEIETVRDKIKSILSENDPILKECLRATFKLKTLVDKIFGGSCVNTVICRECHHPLQLIEPFLDLSVPMPDSNEPVSPSIEMSINASTCPILLRQHLKDQDTSMFTCLEMNENFSPSPDSLEHCLKLFTSLDVLDEDNKFICDYCTDELKKKKKQEGSSDDTDYAECLVSKQLLIHELPPILILHMKRFHLGLRVTKNNNQITFPNTLNVAPYCTDLRKGAMEYDLYGVVQHSGSLQGGHYVAYVKYKNTKEKANGDEGSVSSTTKDTEKYGHDDLAEAELGYREPSEDIWCYTSDSYVNLAREDEVHNSQAYLLLYVQRN